MTPLLNYFVEANLCLLFFLVIYVLGLQKETQFSLKRAYIMGALVFSLVYPLIELPSESANEFIPSVSHAVPSYLLPEHVLNNQQPTTEIEPTAVTPTFDFWTSVRYLYLGGLVLFLGVFVAQLLRLLYLILQSEKYSWNNCWVAESKENQPTFSFFNFIFIGNVGQLNDKEKQVVLRHESIHAHRLHSLDLLLVNLIGIVFWFNPFIRVYKRLLIQLHEFEADALTIENHDVKSYCDLMAKLALQSAGFSSIVNHFNQSLTIKRITMMKRMKKNMKSWKVVAVALAFPICFFVVACQDQDNSFLSVQNPATLVVNLEEPLENHRINLVRFDGSKDHAVDSVEVDKESQTFSFQRPENEVSLYRLTISGKRGWFTFVWDKDARVNLRTDSIWLSSIEGSPASDEYLNYQKYTLPLYNKVIDYSVKFNSVESEDSVKYYVEKQNQVVDKLHKAALHYVKTNESSFTTLYLLYWAQSFRDMGREEVLPYYNLLSDEWKQHSLAKDIMNSIEEKQK